MFLYCSGVHTKPKKSTFEEGVTNIDNVILVFVNFNLHQHTFYGIFFPSNKSLPTPISGIGSKFTARHPARALKGGKLLFFVQWEKTQIYNTTA